MRIHQRLDARHFVVHAASLRDRFTLGALVAFLVTVADLGMFNIGAAFWGLVAGFAVSWVLERRDFVATGKCASPYIPRAGRRGCGKLDIHSPSMDIARRPMLANGRSKSPLAPLNGDAAATLEPRGSKENSP